MLVESILVQCMVGSRLYVANVMPVMQSLSRSHAPLHCTSAGGYLVEGDTFLSPQCGVPGCHSPTCINENDTSTVRILLNGVDARWHSFSGFCFRYTTPHVHTDLCRRVRSNACANTGSTKHPYNTETRAQQPWHGVI